MKFLTWVVVLLLAVLSGCQGQQTNVSYEPANALPVLAQAGGSDQESDFDEFELIEEDISEQMIQVYDPIEGWNRGVFKFNDGVFLIVINPVVKGYEKLVPRPGRIAIRNFFYNLDMPSQLINCLLQGKFDKAGRELSRFGINSTLGVLGLFDVAQKKYGLEPVNEDFGQTLAVWGFGDGFYLVWPFIGPSTVRDSVGTVADQFGNVLRYVDPFWLSVSISGLKGVNAVTFFIDEYEALTAEALDPYVFIRQTYAQYRRKKIME